MNKFTRDLLSCIIFLVIGTTFVYGQIKFPDAPITLVDNNKYEGKQGQPRSEEDFDQFSTWSTSMYFLVPAGIIGVASLQQRRIKGKM